MRSKYINPPLGGNRWLTVGGSGPQLSDSPRRGSFSPALWIFLLGLSAAIQLKGFALTGFTVLGTLSLLFSVNTRRFRLSLPLILAAALQVAMWYSNHSRGIPLVTPVSLVGVFYGLNYLAVRATTRGNTERVVTLISGLAGGTIIWYLSVGTVQSRLNGAALWKYGLAVPVTIIVVVLASRSSRRSVPVIALLCVSALSLGLDYRSHSGICVAAALLTLRRNDLGVERSSGQVFRTVILVATAVPLMLFVVNELAANNLIGGQAAEKFEEQKDVNSNFLLAGRTELPMSVSAIRASPLVGWGSIPSVPYDVTASAFQTASSLGYKDPAALVRYWFLRDAGSATGSVNSHSIFFGSWVQAGILGIALPGYILYIAVRSLARGSVGRKSALSPALLAYMSLQVCWDLVFSPFTYNTVAMLAAYTVLVAPESIAEKGELRNAARS